MSSSAYFCRFVGDGATSSAIEENSIRFFGGMRFSAARSTGGVGVDFLEKSVGVDEVGGMWLEIARSAALKLYFGRTGLSRSDFVGVDRLSECGDDTPVSGGGVSILLEDELDEDFGGFISRVLSASC